MTARWSVDTRIARLELAVTALRQAVRRAAGRVWSCRGASHPGAVPTNDGYSAWLVTHEPDQEDLRRLRTDSARWRHRPLISIIVPVFNPEPAWLEDMAASVRAQAYESWELCLADDGSTDHRVRPTLEALATSDPRIRARYRPLRGGIAAASNTALQMAGGEYVALLDHDDVLRPHALHQVVEALQEEPDLDLLYSDEDKILSGGGRGSPHFKGGFDPDCLLSVNYICHLTVIRRSLMVEIGGFREGFEGSQDHDLVLRATDVTRRVRHLASVLYSWRQVPGSAAVSVEAKPAAWQSGRLAVADAMRRRGIRGRAELGPLPGLYQARPEVLGSPTVALIIQECAASTGRRNVDALMGSAGHLMVGVIAVGSDPGLEALRRPGLDVVIVPGPDQKAALLNAAIRATDADVVAFVDGRLAPARTGRPWLLPLLEQALRTEVGLAGGRTVDSRGAPVQEGLRLGRGTVPASLGVRWPVIQRVSAVSIALMAGRRRELLATGGFDERFRRDLYDVELCLRLRQRGLAVVYTPLAELGYAGGTPNLGPSEDDLETLAGLWGPVEQLPDPYLSPYLDSVDPLLIRLT
jgi:GT2 family glycosyltransferase